MLNSKAKKELSPKDHKFLEGLVGLGIAGLTPVEKAHVISRRDYLSKETIKEMGIDELVEDGAGDIGNVQVSPYASMKSKELKELCKDRGLTGVTKVDEMVDALTRDDAGEFDEDEGEDGNDGEDGEDGQE